jgi:two-component system cell cycle sensor histidine kinase/response regulator CckA
MPIAADPIAPRSPFADAFPDIVARFDRDLRHLYVNRRAEEVTGRPAGDFIGRSNRELGMPDSLVELWDAKIREVFSTGRPLTVEFAFHGPGGARQFESRIAPELAEDGQVATVIGVTRDVTERKRLEERLREHQAFLEKAQEVAHVGSWISGPGPDDPLSWSHETCRIFGFEESAFDGRVATFFDRVHPEDRERVGAAARAALATGMPYEVDHRIVRPDGSVRWVHEQADVVSDGQGRPQSMIGTVQDITERKSLEDQLLQAQKMEAMGRLAGGVAHDFNNLLTAILGYADIVMRRLGPAHALRPKVEEIKKAGERASGLTRQLLAFSRKQVLQPRVVDLNMVVGDVEKMLYRIIGEDVHIANALDPDLGRVRADPAQLEQILINLAVNARDAMPSGGSLVLETANAELDAAYAREHVGVAPGRYVMLAVSDTGTGMDAETRRHIFEPFFTTKPPGKGTGLGLATVYGIVAQSGGHIWVYSEEGLGSVFKVYLPRIDAPAEVEPPRPSAAAGGTETLLLVEDEAGVRELMSEVLTGLGYVVLAAHRAEDALDRAAAHAGPLDMVISDVVLPGMGGPALVEKLRERRPGLRALLISGYTDEAMLQRGIVEEGAAVLAKPFSPEALGQRVREMLDAPPAP